MEENKDQQAPEKLTLVERADKVLADYSKRTGIAISPDLTEEQRVKIANQLGEFEKKWASLDRRGRRRAFKGRYNSSNRIKTIMKGHAIKELIVKKYEKAIKRQNKIKKKNETVSD